MSFGRVEVLAVFGRRRRWSRAKKEHWVLALMAPGASSSAVVREAGVDRGQLYRWRKELSDLAAFSTIPAFVPVAVAGAAPRGVVQSELAGSFAAITIEFGLGLRMKIEGAPDQGTLELVVRVLSGTGNKR